MGGGEKCRPREREGGREKCREKESPAALSSTNVNQREMQRESPGSIIVYLANKLIF